MVREIKKLRNILVLEDEPLIAMMLADELEALGIHVVGPVNNLKSAVLLAETSQLDGALLDLSINGAYATEVAEKLRARDIPFAFVTGYGRPPGLKYRDAAVLQKPFTQSELQTTVVALFLK